MQHRNNDSIVNKIVDNRGGGTASKTLRSSKSSKRSAAKSKGVPAIHSSKANKLLPIDKNQDDRSDRSIFDRNKLARIIKKKNRPISGHPVLVDVTDLYAVGLSVNKR